MAEPKEAPKGMARDQLLRRYIVFIVGLWFIALGCSTITKMSLGTTPISSIPYSLSLINSSLTFGNWTILYSVLLVTVYGLLMWKYWNKVDKINIIPTYALCVVYGYMLDLIMGTIYADLSVSEYWLKIVVIVIGICIQAFGVYMCVISHSVLGPGDAFVYSLAYRSGYNYGYVRVASDCSMVIIAAIISLICLGTLGGVREGTVIAMICTGLVMRQYMKHCGKLTNWMIPGEDTTRMTYGKKAAEAKEQDEREKANEGVARCPRATSRARSRGPKPPRRSRRSRSASSSTTSGASSPPSRRP